MSQQPPEWDNSGAIPPPPPPPPPAGYLPQPSGSSVPGAAPKIDGLAIASLCCSLAFLVIACLGIVTSILAVIFGGKAQRRIRESNGMLTGEGLAKAGLIIGWVGIGFWVLGALVYVVFIVAIFLGSDSSSAMGALH